MRELRLNVQFIVKCNRHSDQSHSCWTPVLSSRSKEKEKILPRKSDHKMVQIEGEGGAECKEIRRAVQRNRD